ISELQKAGIKTTLLKGTALIVDYYQDYGIRFMDDFDIFVPVKDAIPGINLIKNLGWKSPEIDSYSFAFKHAMDFQKENKYNLDLHWHIIPHCLKNNDDDDFWSRVILTKINDLSIYTLSPTDHLFHVCIHGSRWHEEISPIRWVADAMIIINLAGDKIDWETLVILAEKRKLVLRLKHGLMLLKELLNAPIPEHILQKLEAIPISQFDLLVYKATTREGGEEKIAPIFWSLILKYYYYLEVKDQHNLILNLLGFPRYLQYAWDLDYLWQVPGYMITKLSKRIYQDLLKLINSAFRLFDYSNSQ
ncbi:MAG TPA: nucleotidyltransferase family protein, partial [Allocoleopsis sp.]